MRYLSTVKRKLNTKTKSELMKRTASFNCTSLQLELSTTQTIPSAPPSIDRSRNRMKRLGWGQRNTLHRNSNENRDRVFFFFLLLVFSKLRCLVFSFDAIIPAFPIEDTQSTARSKGRAANRSDFKNYYFCHKPHPIARRD